MPFCSKCGKEHTDEDLFCSKCGASLKGRGEAITEVIEVDYPVDENPMLELGVPVSGRLEINPGGEKLVEGSIHYDVPQWKPHITETSNRVSIRQEERWLHTHFDNPRNDWSLNLGKSKPFSLHVKTGVSRSKLSLGGVPLTKLRVNSGVGACRMKFDEVNPETMQLLRVESGVGQTEVQDILNANPREIKVAGDVGEVKLGFTGEPLQSDLHARIEAGVGGFELSIREDVSAVIRVNGLAGVSLRGAMRIRRKSFGSGVYETEAYTGEGASLDIRVSMGLGGLTLRTV